MVGTSGKISQKVIPWILPRFILLTSSHDFMESHKICLQVANILEDFTTELKYCHQTISVKYSCLKRQYGCKIIIVAKNKLDKTIFYSLIKVRSFPELESLKHLLNGMQQSIDTYHNIPLEDDSD